MKIFDATSLIAFLSEMKYPDGLRNLSKHYKLIVPKGVASEIRKQPGKKLLEDLQREKVLDLVSVDQQKLNEIQNENPQLHLGECEAITYAKFLSGTQKVCILSDDLKARKKFPNLNFKWTERLLDIMKEKGLIDESDYKKKIQILQSSSFYRGALGNGNRN